MNIHKLRVGTVIRAGLATQPKEIFMGAGPNDVFIINTKTNKALQIHDDGEISYNNSTIFHNANCTISKATNGYAKFPNGLIIQWFQDSSNNTSNKTTIFPTSFTTTNYSCVGTMLHVNDALAAPELARLATCERYYVDKVVWSAITVKDNGGTSVPCRFIAIGY